MTGKTRGTATIMVTADDGNGAQATCEVEVKQYVTEITIDKTLLSLVIGDIAVLSVTSILPESANDMNYSWSSSDDNIATVDNSGKVTAKAKGNAIIKAMANDGSEISASCSLVVFARPDAIDMGTEVNGKKIKWASHNIGASSPEEYGSYYAWGETETKSDYSWSTYKFGTSSSGPFSKYNTINSYGIVDNKTVLDLEDDIANVKLGDNWRIPTEEDWAALRAMCTWSWTTQNGVNGMLVTATNGNSIFLPAAGFWSNSSLKLSGTRGYYWSSAICIEQTYNAWYLIFDSGDVVISGGMWRCFGHSVRPVTE